MIETIFVSATAAIVAMSIAFVAKYFWSGPYLLFDAEKKVLINGGNEAALGVELVQPGEGMGGPITVLLLPGKRVSVSDLTLRTGSFITYRRRGGGALRYRDWRRNGDGWGFVQWVRRRVFVLSVFGDSPLHFSRGVKYEQSFEEDSNFGTLSLSLQRHFYTERRWRKLMLKYEPFHNHYTGGSVLYPDYKKINKRDSSDIDHLFVSSRRPALHDVWERTTDGRMFVVTRDPDDSLFPSRGDRDGVILWSLFGSDIVSPDAPNETISVILNKYRLRSEPFVLAAQTPKEGEVWEVDGSRVFVESVGPYVVRGSYLYDHNKSEMLWGLASFRKFPEQYVGKYDPRYNYELYRWRSPLRRFIAEVRRKRRRSLLPS